MRIHELDESLWRMAQNMYRNQGAVERPLARMYSNPRNLGAMVDPAVLSHIPVTRVRIGALQPWEPTSKMARVDSAGNVDKIAQSIQQGAAVPPITVVELSANRYRIIDGHHRYHAYQQAGIEDIPVQIIPKNQVRYTDELLPK